MSPANGRVIKKTSIRMNRAYDTFAWGLLATLFMPLSSTADFVLHPIGPDSIVVNFSPVWMLNAIQHTNDGYLLDRSNSERGCCGRLTSKIRISQLATFFISTRNINHSKLEKCIFIASHAHLSSVVGHRANHEDSLYLRE